MVDLSQVAAQTCAARTSRPMEILVGDAFGLLADGRRSWPLVAMIYVQELSTDELTVLINTLWEARRLGGGFFLEFFRFALPVWQEERFVTALGIEGLDVSRDGRELVRLEG